MEIEEFTELTFDVDSGVACVVLNRPDRRNAWSGRMAVEYRWALHHAHTRDDVRVVVLSGAGGDFCVGADSGLLGSIADGDGRYQPERLPLPPFPADTPESLRRNHAYPLTLSTPVIAAVTGACAGAGFVLATYVDARIVATDARITTSFAKLGLPAEYGMGWLLPRMIGIPNAADLLYSARVIDGEESVRLGWAQRCWAADEVVDQALSMARKLAIESSSESLRMMKRQLFIDSAGPFGDAYTRSVNDMNTALAGTDIAEGLAALRERRATDFLTVRESPRR
ncbi:enoyl-CoA hydratase-related protein [Mycobacterium sp. 236(2023)]|uniref:enoyl-CoA hydratase-related protein n=1 Tax=Mycobacterium sp. 236(2023) TaxID=3038163 RepID=UPI002414E613|nr:enoyl-CoA hydratase-related protein [Mycobacterium sp. 236(2023)]MDG4668084.1 enoyl-CoA hydratase-related protein [Mycobacterium sp. 236(2023)]